MVPSGTAGCHPPVRFSRSQKPRRRRAVKAIRQGVKALDKFPQMGRPVDELPLEFREWVIEFGSGAYVALYHFDKKEVVILAGKHGRDAGY
jgi:plasmid stabilization system protein ParE